MKMISGYLGPDLKVEGDVESKESIRIDGEYKGNINSQREVTIGPSGDVEGEIHAPIIRVSGSVKGSLHASRLLELLGEARVQGDLNTPPGGLSTEPGGAFEGKFVITPGTVSSGNDSVGG
ncbi:MAG: polymer-forming cytoskeletal protein [SAR324 cluster bacterium]|nr:polymer-forming cytoskeletal protein [SAR324 cluster bacterium]